MGQRQLKRNREPSVVNRGDIVCVENETIISAKHDLMTTMEQNKIALSVYCDKRFYLDPINSLTFEYKIIRKFAFHNDRLNNCNWETNRRKRLEFNFTPKPEKRDIGEQWFLSPVPGSYQQD